MRNAILCSLAVLALWNGASAQKVVFRPGEELHYTVNYSAAVVDTEVADVTMRVSSDNLDGTPCYKIHARGTTRPFYSIFFKMEDTYQTWMQRNDLRPLLATGDLKEGGYEYRSRLVFNWKSRLVYTSGKNIKRNTEHTKTIPLKSSSYDALSLFYNLRCLDLDDLPVGQRRNLHMVLVDTIRTIQYRLLGFEKRTIPNLGTVECLKFACQLAANDAESFEEGSEFLIWISNDRNKIPVYLESPIRVGKVYAKLVDFKGLAYPFTSKAP